MFIAFDFLVVVLVLQLPPTTLDGWMDANSCSIDDRWFSKIMKTLADTTTLCQHKTLVSSEDLSCFLAVVTTWWQQPACLAQAAVVNLHKTICIAVLQLVIECCQLSGRVFFFFFVAFFCWKKVLGRRRNLTVREQTPLFMSTPCTCPFSFCEKCDGGHCAMGRWRMIFFSWRRLQRSCPLKGRSNLNVSLCEKIVSNLMNIQLRTSSWELRKTFFSFFFNEF